MAGAAVASALRRNGGTGAAFGPGFDLAAFEASLRGAPMTPQIPSVQDVSSLGMLAMPRMGGY
jgi:hypothetical protein